MRKVLVAGASGYLGKFVVKEFKNRGYWVRAFVRNPKKLGVIGPYLEPAVMDIVDDVFVGDVTKPETLKGACKDIDVVFSSIGITKPNEKADFMDVDYKGNKLLLEEALKEGVEKFIFVSVYRAREFQNVKALKAREMLVSELEKSGIEYTVIRPTGFFSDMTEFLKMANKGRVYLIGNGNNKINPIHGEDLAKVIVDTVSEKLTEVPVGGPEVFTYREIAELSFKVLGKNPKITHIPVKPVKALAKFVKIFNKRYYEFLSFFITAMTNDFVAPKSGTHKLEEYYKELINAKKIS